jgi:hypothetical protein
MTEALEVTASAARRAGVQIHSVHSVMPSLEDAFVQLTHVGADAMGSNAAVRQRGGGRS